MAAQQILWQYVCGVRLQEVNYTSINRGTGWLRRLYDYLRLRDHDLDSATRVLDERSD